MTPESLRKFCLSLPAVTEDVKWGADLCFCIGEKMFCVTSLEGPFKLSFKVPDEDYEELSVREGFEPAPYMARNKWVLLSSPAKVKPKELEGYIRQSYELIKSKLTKKLQKELGIA